MDVAKGEHAEGWCDRGRCQGQGEMEADYPLMTTKARLVKRRRQRRRNKEDLSLFPFFLVI